MPRSGNGSKAVADLDRASQNANGWSQSFMEPCQSTTGRAVVLSSGLQSFERRQLNQIKGQMNTRFDELKHENDDLKIQL